MDASSQMLNNIKNDIDKYGPGYSNWASVMLCNIYPFYELAIVGENVEKIQMDL